MKHQGGNDKLLSLLCFQGIQQTATCA